MFDDYYRQNPEMRTRNMAAAHSQREGVEYEAVFDDKGYTGFGEWKPLKYEDAKALHIANRVSQDDMEQFAQYHIDPDFEDVKKKGKRPTTPSGYQVTDRR